MIIHLIYKKTLIELTGAVIIKALFLDSDVEVNLIGINKFLCDESLISELKSNICSHSEALHQEGVRFNSCVIALNRYNSREFEKMMNTLPNSIFKIIMEEEGHSGTRLSNTKAIPFNSGNYFQRLLEGIETTACINNLIDSKGFDNLKELCNNIGFASSSILLEDIIVEQAFEGQAYCNLINEEDFNSMTLELVSGIDMGGLRKCNTDEDFNELRKSHARILKLHDIVKLSKGIYDNLGAKLSLSANYKKLEWYYNWLANKLILNKIQRQSKEVFTSNFFSEKEINVMYRSLDSRLISLDNEIPSIVAETYSKEDCTGKIDTIIVINTEKANKTLSEIFLRIYYSEFDNNVSVCLIGDKFAVISKFDEESVKVLNSCPTEERYGLVQQLKNNILSRIVQETNIERILDKV